MSFMTLSAVTGEKPTKLDGGDGEKLGEGAPSVSFPTSATFFPKNNMKSFAQKSVLSNVISDVISDVLAGYLQTAAHHIIGVNGLQALMIGFI